jgi:glycerophosphoryl diester phosphodiesterase
MIDRKVIAHRFGAGLGPESTVAALNNALDLGVSWMEFDASLLKDGTVIVFHDDTFDRCTNATGVLSETNWDTVQKMDAGSWFDDTFKGEKILELGQALEILDQKGVKINLEIKVNHTEEVQLVDTVLALTHKIWTRPNDLIFSSFSHCALVHLHCLDNKAPIGHLFEELPFDWLEQAQAVSALSIHVDADKITPDQIKQIKNASYLLHAYTVNDLEKAKSLFDLGVDSIFTDYPDRFPDEWR